MQPLDDNLLSRMSSNVHRNAPVDDAMEALVLLCERECRRGFRQGLPTTLNEDSARVLAWLERVAVWMPHRPAWSVHSWVFGLQLIPRDDGSAYLRVELEGYDSAEWDDMSVDETMYHPEEYTCFIESLDNAYQFISSCADCDDAARQCGEFVICLGLAAILIRAAVASCHSECFTERRIYVCWAGGDHIEILKEA